MKVLHDGSEIYLLQSKLVAPSSFACFSFCKRSMVGILCKKQAGGGRRTLGVDRQAKGDLISNIPQPRPWWLIW
jgi:hypothetical protein